MEGHWGGGVWSVSSSLLVHRSKDIGVLVKCRKGCVRLRSHTLNARFQRKNQTKRIPLVP